MGIYIKGMEMPRFCYDCFFRPGLCKERDFYSFDGENKLTRPRNCPLIELPPHGRLIDADALMKSIASTKATSRNAFGVYMLYGVISDAVINAPTIIEAEGGAE